MVRKFLVTTASVIALVSAANAADIYSASYKDTPYVAANWAGFYAGANGGYAWADHSNQYALGSFGGIAPEGGFGGGQIGYNWQGVWHPHLVLGIEADIQGTGIEDSASFGGGKFDSKLDWFGTVRGRIGYAFGPTLVYGTGGFAYGGVDNRITGGFGTTGSYNKTATGYAAGGGIEYKLLNPAWSVKAEYQYIDLGKNDVTSPAGATYPGKTYDDAYHTVRAGLNYHFGNEIAPLK